MKRLLVVVDMQNDFISGSLGSGEAMNVVERVIEKVKEYEKNGDEILFTLDTHQEDYLETLEGKNLRVLHCVKESEGWRLHERLEHFEGIRFEKNAFGSMACAEYVAKNSYESIELVGLCTDICVISNALLLKSACPFTPIIVDASCCVGVTKESHENALEAMRMCQIQVINDED